VIIIVAIYKKPYRRIHNEIESAGTVETNTYIHIWLSKCQICSTVASH